MLDVWQIELLGGLCVRNSETTFDRFRTQSAALLLASLALTPPHQVCTRDALAFQLWENDEADTARTKLRIALSSLRRQLEPPGTAPKTVIDADRFGVRLRPGSFVCDVREFERACDLLQPFTPETVPLDKIERALALYGGELLPHFHEHWILGLRESLYSRSIRLLLQASSACERDLKMEKALHYAERALGADPLNEAPCLRLMELLIRTGQASSAVRCYQALENRLRDTLGTTPSAELRNLLLKSAPSPPQKEKALFFLSSGKRGAESRGHPPVSASPALPLTGGRNEAPCRLPLLFTRFFGRTEEKRTLEVLLTASMQGNEGTSRLLTLTGMGGAGKTRLAVEIARLLHTRYGIAVFFVGLSDTKQASEILPAIVRSLGLPFSEESPLAALEAALGKTPTLFVLDNLEHLAYESGPVLEELLQNLPQACFLVTSRQSLGLTAERLFPLSSLPIPVRKASPETLVSFPSVSLFVDRAQAIRPDFGVTAGNSRAVGALCRKLEGMPLAIELAAAWAGTLSPQQMLTRLEKHFDALPSRRRDSAARHRSLSAVMEWSCGLLSEEQQKLFERLSVFREGFCLEAGEAVGRSPDTPPLTPLVELLAQLTDSSLLQCDPPLSPEENEPMRYRMLESLREFGLDRLREEQKQPLSLAHALYYASLLQRAKPALEGADQGQWLQKLQREKSNLNAALDFLETQPDQTVLHFNFCVAMFSFWNARGYLSEGNLRLGNALLRPDLEKYPSETSAVLRCADTIARLRGDLAQAQEYGEKALSLARALQDPLLISRALGGLGSTLKNRGDYRAARALYEEALALAQQGGSRVLCATLIGNLANTEKAMANFTEARTRYEESLALHRELGNTLGQTVQLCNLAGLCGDTGDYEGGWRLGVECLELCCKIEDKSGIAYALEILGYLCAEQKQDAAASQCFAVGEAMREEIEMGMSPVEVEGREEILAPVRKRLGAAMFEETWKSAKQRGAAAKIEEIISTKRI